MATYQDLAAIKGSSAFVDRCTISIASYAKYILGQTNEKARNLTWASQAFQNPSGVFVQLSTAIVLDAVFADLPDGTTNIDTLTDTQIDNAVQTTINSTVLV